MSLISNSYFYYERTVPNVATADQSAYIADLISKYEREYLIGVLGYELFELFEAGIKQPVIDQRYIDVLYGKTFTDGRGVKRKWDGLIPVAGNTAIISPPNLTANTNFWFEVGVNGSAPGQVNGPAVGATTFTLAALKPPYRVYQRGLGELFQDYDVDKNDGNFVLLGGVTFATEGVFDVKFDNPYSVTGVDNVALAPSYRSPIADYVYWHYLRSRTGLVGDTGILRTGTKDAVMISPVDKMVSAWNDMATQNAMLWGFFKAYATTYPEWSFSKVDQKFFTYENSLNF